MLCMTPHRTGRSLEKHKYTLLMLQHIAARRNRYVEAKPTALLQPGSV